MKLVLLLSAVLAVATAAKGMHNFKAQPRKEDDSNGKATCVRACVSRAVATRFEVVRLRYGAVVGTA